MRFVKSVVGERIAIYVWFMHQRPVIVLSIIVFGIFFLFMSLTPRAIKAISSTELIEINEHLQQEIDARRQAETEKLTAQTKYSNLLKLAPTKLESSKHDGYFQQSWSERWLYQKLFAQYAEQTKAEQQQVDVRRCGCGTPLRHRQRHCDSCTMKRRRRTKRDMRNVSYKPDGVNSAIRLAGWVLWGFKCTGVIQWSTYAKSRLDEFGEEPILTWEKIGLFPATQRVLTEVFSWLADR